MKKIYLLLFLLNNCLIVSAQKSPCQVITARFDTLTGICIQADRQLILLQNDPKDKVVFHPEAIYEYALLQSDGTAIPYQYILQPETGQRKPMRRVVDGYYKLYVDKKRARSTVNPALPKNSSVPRLISVYYLTSYSEDAVEVSPKNWERVLYQRMADFPMLVENRMRNDFQFKQLPHIVAAYNAFVRQQVINQQKADTPIMEK